MNFNLTKEQLMIRKTVREFAEKEVAPLAIEIDKSGEFPWKNVKKMARYGFLGLPISQKYGGAGADYVSYAIMIEEISRVCASTGVIVESHVSLGAEAIELFGTEEQKQKYLLPLARGEKLGAFALTEPNAGTDAGAMQTKAVLDGDHYVLNGNKMFITNAGAADSYVVFAMTKPGVGTKGISAFIVEKEMPGFSVGHPEDKMGIRASKTAELVFENVRVPKENLLGREGEGFKIAMTTLDGGRIGIASQALGIAQGALDAAIKYAKEREQFGKPIASFQAVQWMLADMAVEVQAARFFVYYAAFLKSQGQRFSKEAAMAKLYASKAAMFCADKAVQIHGGYGYMRDYQVERFLRDAKITEIYEGTSEVQRMVIAGNILR
ncbi:acyl-CoA dehydrogenase [Thermanaerosceptrum fracticalcis]|jgi:butyryl-CoA dehydrogenase|uniref:Acyl-CoA dehydrogenase n=1 Tax=Thermanaerosceptrum fracticalcis TaxID=1712410 RepID=A0A7G6E3T1_THEFR|nr:acyl-CoA dehydrogenase [Thermanaerosceptrum fracticalcis]QNB46735.1 acyl-CoA dehydrogenase [Thermanaerosceptrum fracticalcis]